MLTQQDQLLIEILADGLFHSGTELAQQLGISRVAIWKRLQRFGAFGLEVQSVPGRGYRFLRPLELLHAETLLSSMGASSRALLKNLSLELVVDSTNKVLMKGVERGIPSGSVEIAEYQTEGRGRLGNRWLAPFASAVCLSVFWRFESSREVAGLSLAVAVSLIRAFRRLGFSGVSLKWPNDLFLEGKKLGGILIEMAGEAHGASWVVVGIGINYRLPPEFELAVDQPSTDLERVAGVELPGRNQLIGVMIDELLPVLEVYPSTGLEPFLPEWRNAHGFQGHAAALRLGENEMIGTIEDIDSHGLLVFRVEDGTLRTFASGEIRLRIRP